MIPFAASVEQYALLARGGAFTVEGKERARTLIEGPRGREMLSVPVSGGSHALRGRRAVNPEIAQHARWQEMHLGAWRAAYGRTPFFAHLFPEIERVYAGHSRGLLGDFNAELHAVAMRWLGLPESADTLRAAMTENPERFAAVIEGYRNNLTPGISIFDALFRYGKDTLFLLFAIDAEDGLRNP